MASMVMSYNQSYAIKNHQSTDDEQLLSTETLLLFGVCCIGPGILLAILFSTICCKQPWEVFCLNCTSSSREDEGNGEDYDETSEELAIVHKT